MADYSTSDPEIAELLDRLQGSEQLPFLAIFPAGAPEKVIRFQGYSSSKQLTDALEKAGPSKAKSEGAVDNVTVAAQSEPVIMTSRLP